MFWQIFGWTIGYLFWSIIAAPPLAYNDLAIPVPSPEDMNPQADAFVPAQLMSGVRVVTGSSSCDQSAIATTFEQTRPGTKINEAWTFAGSGHIQDPSRCKRIKRSFRRACKRSLLYGCVQYKGKELWPSMVPFRMKQLLMTELRHRPAVKPQHVNSMPSTSEALQIFCWNASQSLQLEEWITWCSTQPYTLVLVQETSWNLNRRWTAPGWYMIHSSAGRASTLCMVRSTLLRPDQLTYADVLPGRLQHIRLYLTRIHDVFNIYQVAWNTTKPRNVLLQERALVWQSLKDAIQHVPKGHMLLIAGDCNTPVM